MSQPTNRPRVESTPARNAVVLSVSPHHEDHGFLQRILQGPARTPESNLIAAQDLASARYVFQDGLIAVVVCERQLISGTWREMWEQTSILPDPPLLIVTSRLADEYLWTEALNLGVYDVLSKPFYAPEVTRVIGSALQRWQVRHEANANRAAKPRLAAAGM